MQEGEREKIVTTQNPNTLSPAIRPPFPQRLAQPTNNALKSEIFETLQQVKINIPLLDAIKQMPSYAKFFKDICTVKRKMNVKERAFITE